MKITIFGAGYVGLVTAACFAEMGNDIFVVDTNLERVARLCAGECPIHEPGLPELIQKHLNTRRLHFSTDVAQGVAHGFYQFIAVGTPQGEDGSADLQYVLAVADSIGQYINEHRIVITKSTVPVGTATKVSHTIKRALDLRNCHASFDVASNPEFLREGAAIEDFMNSDRIIIGTDNIQTAEQLRILYAPFNRNNDRLIAMDIRSAELTKYAANTFLAAKISLINELSQLAELLGADIDQVRLGIGSDPRIGRHFINPGCGYGGSCFPKDVRALQQAAHENGYAAQMIQAIQEVNLRQKQVLFHKIQRYFKNDLANRTIAIWGLSFKPNTDDMREASSRTLIEALWQAGAKVQAYDPVAMPEALRIYGERADLKLCETAEGALQGADVLAILTEWNIFFSPDFDLIKRQLKYPVIFDGRNLYNPDFVARLGLKYYAIGRGEMSYA